MRPLHVGVVGGSIAGCATAIELLRGGHRVTVFERSEGAPEGAGIGLLPSTFQSLVSRELIGSDLPRLEVREYVFAARSGDSPLGRAALRTEASVWTVHWSDLWRALRANVSNEHYRGGMRVVGATPETAGRVALQFADGRRTDFDLVVFADGYRSLGRTFVSPESALEYRDYTLWRAVVRGERAYAEPLSGCMYRLGHGDLAGHSVAYALPTGGASGDRSACSINFAAYLPLPAAELEAFLVDRDGKRHRSSLPPGSLRYDTEERLRALLRPRLPPYFARLIDDARDTFAQPIFTVLPPRHRRGCMVTLGDAGTLVPPLMGSGVFKALMQVWSLSAKLRDSEDLEEALAAWDVETCASAAVLSRLGEQMERALVWNLPDLSAISQADARAFWNASTRVSA